MIVGVMATSQQSTTEKYRSLAEAVGAVVAANGFHLLTGGGLGLMQIAGKEFLHTKGRAGKLISVLRAKGTDHLTESWDSKGNLKLNERGRGASAKETVRPWKANEDNKLAEILIRTHLPYSGELGEHDLSRNHINILTSDLIVILPGGIGTLSELRLAYEYDKPTAVFLGVDGPVGRKGAEQIKTEFTGVIVADTADRLQDWLVSSRAKLAAGKRHHRGRFV